MPKSAAVKELSLESLQKEMVELRKELSSLRKEKAEGEKPRRRAKSDESAPKRGLTDWNYYTRYQSDVLRAKNPELKQTEIVKLLAANWTNGDKNTWPAQLTPELRAQLDSKPSASKKK